MTELVYTQILPEWAEALEHIEHSSFPTADRADLYNAKELRALADDFPEGGVVVLDGDTPVAMGLGIRIDFDFSRTQHSIGDLTGADGGSGHVADGSWYYGTSIAVLPQYRRQGIGRRLYDMRKQICRDLDLAGIVAGGVIPGYAAHIGDMSAAAYVDKVAAGDLYDATLTMQLSNGFEARGVIADYIRDPAVGNWASLIVWNNPDYSGA
ncbi:MAG: GNAT family N-acetyltransferase [Acidimicrobiaceae bacterium]|nr:GNAT family N-acetyltransferase [Acidimicrobiaceae bacterium]MCY4280983.1 GNAT family N-acetyltransferase [Acidimicrobiaceae bacterium]